MAENNEAISRMIARCSRNTFLVEQGVFPDFDIYIKVYFCIIVTY